MKLASQKEVDAILNEAKEWALKHTMFRNATGVAALSAAEFTLNREGKTIYQHQAEVSGE